jgi:hypothetical protein
MRMATEKRHTVYDHSGLDSGRDVQDSTARDWLSTRDRERTFLKYALIGVRLIDGCLFVSWAWAR